MRGSDVNNTIGVFVGTGVIGEYFLGFGAAVGAAAYASAGNVCVGTPVGGTADGGVACPVQAGIRTQTIKVRIAVRLITRKYIQKKLSKTEFYATECCVIDQLEVRV
jgi:hypothetical protein